MALVVERQGQGTTSEMQNKPQTCFTCKQKKEGLFTLSAQNQPMCADCARTAKRPID